MNAGTGEKGVTLMEMVVIITVIGLAIPAMLNNFASISIRAIRSEAVADAAFYSQQMMEEVKAKAFVDPGEPNNTALGPNGSEAYPGFNDIDDYDNYARNEGAYSISVSVVYADLNGSSWEVSPDPTGYKLVTVTARNARDMVNSSMATLVAAY